MAQVAQISGSPLSKIDPKYIGQRGMAIGYAPNGEMRDNAVALLLANGERLTFDGEDVSVLSTLEDGARSFALTLANTKGREAPDDDDFKVALEAQKIHSPNTYTDSDRDRDIAAILNENNAVAA